MRQEEKEFTWNLEGGGRELACWWKAERQGGMLMLLMMCTGSFGDTIDNP